MNGFFKKAAAVFCAAAMIAGTGVFAACGGGNDDKIPPVTGETVKYTVLFVRNCDDNVDEPEQEVEEGGKAVFENPARSGWEVEGWYLDAECTQKYDFDTPVTSDLTLYANWVTAVKRYTVEFNLNGIGGEIESQRVAEGEKVTLPEPEAPDGKIFAGWYLDAACNTPFNADSGVTADMTLYAKWSDLVTVTLNPNYEGAAAYTLETEKGTVPDITEPARDGYIFAGWYTDAECTKPYSAAAAESSFMLYAKWVDAAAQVFTYTFKLNYEGAPADIKVEVAAGAIVKTPSVNAPDGKSLEGWYLDAACTERADLYSAAASDLTLYAGWSAVITVTFDYNYEGAPAANAVTLPEGEAVSKPADPVRPGYDFAGWSTAADIDPDYEFGAAAEGPLHLYAQWSRLNVLEAEDVDLTGIQGWGFSGDAKETNMIIADTSGAAEASNGYYLYCLNGVDLTIDFEFTSDRNAYDVDFTVRLSAEIKDITLVSYGDRATEGVFLIEVNGEALDYNEIDITGVPPQSSGEVLPFSDFTYKIDIRKGENHIKLIMANELVQGGTMKSTAPMVDCIKLDTSAVITFTPKEGNY